jgi:hypothetical protein
MRPLGVAKLSEEVEVPREGPGIVRLLPLCRWLSPTHIRPAQRFWGWKRNWSDWLLPLLWTVQDVAVRLGNLVGEQAFRKHVAANVDLRVSNLFQCL